MRFSSRVAAAVAALPMILGTTACGTPKAALTEVSSTPTTTTAAPLNAAPVVHLNRKTFVPAMSAAQAKLRSWSITAKVMVNGFVMVELTGAQTTKPAAISLRMTGRQLGGKTAQITMVKNTVYLSMPGVTPTGKYVRIAADKTGELGQTLARTDPTKIFTSLGASLRSVQYVSPQTLAGEKLEYYEVKVDTAKALKLQGQPVPKGIPRTATYMMWLDSAHRPRYISFELADVTMNMTLTDFNRPVSITAPPASKIVR